MSGVSVVKKFGRNLTIGTTVVPVSIGGVYQTPQSGSATTLRIKAGGNANDDAAGSGAREVTLEGLDENFELVTEAVATAGASASSATTATFTRLFRAYVSASGTYANSSSASHAASIVIENGSGGTDWATIDATDIATSQTEIASYSVPAGKTAYVKIKDVTVASSGGSGRTISLFFFSRANIDDTSAPYSAMRTRSVLNGLEGGSIDSFTNEDVPLGPFAGPHDLGFMAAASSGSTNKCSVEFDIFLIDE